jgi:hypothetical protein
MYKSRKSKHFRKNLRKSKHFRKNLRKSKHFRKNLRKTRRGGTRSRTNSLNEPPPEDPYGLINGNVYFMRPLHDVTIKNPIVTYTNNELISDDSHHYTIENNLDIEHSHIVKDKTSNIRFAVILQDYESSYIIDKIPGSFLGITFGHTIHLIYIKGKTNPLVTIEVGDFVLEIIVFSDQQIIGEYNCDENPPQAGLNLMTTPYTRMKIIMGKNPTFTTLPPQTQTIEDMSNMWEQSEQI